MLNNCALEADEEHLLQIPENVKVLNIEYCFLNVCLTLLVKIGFLRN